ncbi:MAG: DUF1800 domain-containing protein [Planctomycetes bacterium]|nr:DUF1800 domain-containing protein [Planctomycetota bacterium]
MKQTIVQRILGARAMSIGVALVSMVLIAEPAGAQAPTPLAEAEQAVAATQAEQGAAEQVVAAKAAVLDAVTAAVKAAEDAAAKAKAALDATEGDAKAQAQRAFDAAQQAIAALQEAIKPVQTEKAAADEDLAKKTAAATAARRRVVAEKAWAARVAVEGAVNERGQAERTLAEKGAAAAKAAEALAAAQKVATDSAAAKTAAEPVLAEKTQAAKAAADAANAEQDAEKKKALAEAAAKGEQDRVAAEKDLADKDKAAVEGAAKLAEAKAALDAVNAEKAAAETAVNEKTAAIAASKEARAFTDAEALDGLKPITAASWDYAKARHLLFRAGFGGTPQEIQTLVAMGPYDAVDLLVEFQRQPTTQLQFSVPATQRWMAYEQRLHQAARDKMWADRQNGHRAQITALRHWWLRRIVESKRPLEEKLTLFWHDHFATGFSKLTVTTGVQEVLILHQQNEMLRRNVDKFDALLHGIVQDPAMIWYLDNHQNQKGNVNENLGREVLELFSLGEENSANYKPDGYSEKDVRDGDTRSLTGYTVDYWSGQFRFNAAQHDFGEKTLLGQTRVMGPHEAVDVILANPHTARYVAKKLYEYFANRSPDPQIVDRMAHVLRENSYEVRPLLRNLFLSEEFYNPAVMGRQIKSPVELMVGTIKILNLTNVDYGHLDAGCSTMGQTLFEPPSVAGWAEGADWINAERILNRYNYVANMVERGDVDIVANLQGTTLMNASEVVDHLIQRSLLTGVSPEKRQALIEFLGDLPPSTEWAAQKDQINARLRALLVMLMSIPEYQVG